MAAGRRAPCAPPSIRSRSTPFSASASASRTPWRSVRWRTLSGTRLPLAPDDPSRLREKRAPSSSAKSTTVSVTGGVVPVRRRSASRPASTPSGPSSQPPFGTESRWPPMITVSGRAPGSVVQRLPAASLLGVQARSGQTLVEPGSRVAPNRSPRHALGAISVAGPRRQGAQVIDHVTCAQVSPLRRADARRRAAGRLSAGHGARRPRPRRMLNAADSGRVRDSRLEVNMGPDPSRSCDYGARTHRSAIVPQRLGQVRRGCADSRRKLRDWRGPTMPGPGRWRR